MDRHQLGGVSGGHAQQGQEPPQLEEQDEEAAEVAVPRQGGGRLQQTLAPEVALEKDMDVRGVVAYEIRFYYYSNLELGHLLEAFLYVIFIL